jgi:hypothetical protein
LAETTVSQPDHDVSSEHTKNLGRKVAQLSLHNQSILLFTPLSVEVIHTLKFLSCRWLSAVSASVVVHLFEWQPLCFSTLLSFLLQI